MSYPIEVSDDEPIVRALRQPHHVRKGRLVSAAFRPKRGSDKTSVVRWHYREKPEESLKRRFFAFCNQGENRFFGVAVLGAADCRSSGAPVEDARDEYPGHAHLVFPCVCPDGEPLEGKAFEVFNEIIEGLMQRCRLLQDPEPDSDAWTLAIS